MWIKYLNIKNINTIDSHDTEERELSGLSIFKTINYRPSLFLKSSTQDASNHASCLANDDARRTINICTCKRRLCELTSLEDASILSYAKKLKNLNFLGVSSAERVNSQLLYTLVRSVGSVLSVSGVCYQKTDSLNFLQQAFIKLASFVLHSVWISILACW